MIQWVSNFILTLITSVYTLSGFYTGFFPRGGGKQSMVILSRRA